MWAVHDNPKQDLNWPQAVDLPELILGRPHGLTLAEPPQRVGRLCQKRGGRSYKIVPYHSWSSTLRSSNQAVAVWNHGAEDSFNLDFGGFSAEWVRGPEE